MCAGGMTLPGLPGHHHTAMRRHPGSCGGGGGGAAVVVPQKGPLPLDVAALESTLGFRVNDASRYAAVFQHRSLKGCESYERLELLGDAVLGFVVAEWLFDAYPDADEGFLTRARNKLVSSKMLASLARALGLQRFVQMNGMGMSQGLHHNQRILEDVFEALVGCILKDLGMRTAKEFVLWVMQRHVPWDTVFVDTNYKDILARWVQAQGAELPVYSVLNDPATDFKFHVRVEFAGQRGEACELSKKEAEQNAARDLLHRAGGPVNVRI